MVFSSERGSGGRCGAWVRAAALMLALVWSTGGGPSAWGALQEPPAGGEGQDPPPAPKPETPPEDSPPVETPAEDPDPVPPENGETIGDQEPESGAPPVEAAGEERAAEQGAASGSDGSEQPLDPAGAAGPEDPRPPPASGATEGVAPGAELVPAGGEVAPTDGASEQPGGESAAAAARPELPDFAPAYRDAADVGRLLEEMARAAAPAARAFELPTATDRAPLMMIEFGRAGEVPLAERPTVLLVGGLDGISLAGGEAVLAVTRGLLGAPERMPEGVAFVAVPWAAPRSLAHTLAGDLRDGRGDSPLDEDGDGRVDEDGPDDVDGDGMLLSMLIEDARGEWTTCRDGRFLVPAGPGDAPRFRIVPEGRDDDGDGRFNEDPLGGVVPDRNFPLGRDGAWSDPLTGRLPLSEPEARALADLALERRTAVVLLYQGNHGGVAMPGGSPGPGGVELPLAADLHLFQRATEAFAAHTSRTPAGPRTLREARGREVHGASIDWFYAGAGAFALEVAPWGPRVDANGGAAVQDARYQTGGASKRALGARPEPCEVDRNWASWLDNTRGGLGFVDWHPVELGRGDQAFVGGWEPRTIENPPLESLPGALEGLMEFTSGLALGVPRLEVRVISAVREGEVVRLRARVKNLGALPTGLAGAQGPGGRGALRLELVVPPDARLIAGEPVVNLGRLDGGELSRDVDWILLAPSGALVELRSDSELALPVSVEVRP